MLRQVAKRKPAARPLPSLAYASLTSRGHAAVPPGRQVSVQRRVHRPHGVLHIHRRILPSLQPQLQVHDQKQRVPAGWRPLRVQLR